MRRLRHRMHASAVDIIRHQTHPPLQVDPAMRVAIMGPRNDVEELRQANLDSSPLPRTVFLYSSLLYYLFLRGKALAFTVTPLADAFFGFGHSQGLRRIFTPRPGVGGILRSFRHPLYALSPGFLAFFYTSRASCL
jgi:hypothetical protein